MFFPLSQKLQIPYSSAGIHFRKKMGIRLIPIRFVFFLIILNRYVIEITKLKNCKTIEIPVHE